MGQVCANTHIHARAYTHHTHARTDTQVGCTGTFAYFRMAWKVMETAQADNRESRPEDYLQWWEHSPGMSLGYCPATAPKQAMDTKQQ